MQTPVHTFHLDCFDPLQLMQGLFPGGPGFLESPGGSGRFSIVPLRCAESYRLDDSGLVKIGPEGEKPLGGDPFQTLERILRQRQIPRHPGGPVFPGGFFGYLAYDLAGWIEDLPRQARRDRAVPHLWLDWVDQTAVYDHKSKTLTLSSLNTGDDLASLEIQVRRTLEEPVAEGPIDCVSLPAPLIPQEQFEAMVARAKEYIAAGDVYQANLSCRFDGKLIGTTADLYRKLRRVNPSPFACLLRSPGLEIISSSPERLVSLHGEMAETRPIAGTRPRGFTLPEDAELGRELLGHPKERAEHVMLLDLERNDLGKVCRAGSVEVNELMVLERYSHVTHIVSNVRGLLRNEVGPFELIRAMFPGGTITGVPKKRCMEIIDELEPVGRGTYTGSAGYISATGDMDLNILIRTFQRFGDELTYQVGAGIVADSVPEREWHECLAKGMALRKTLEQQP